MLESQAESRSAIRAAMRQADIVRTSTVERIDPYEREARALIRPGLNAETVTEIIIRRMALKLTKATPTSHVFAIDHSTQYSTLTVHTSNNCVVSYALC